MTELADAALEKAKAAENEIVKDIADTEKGRHIATKLLKKWAKPCYALLLAWLGSLAIGGISPVNGYLII